MRNRTPVVVVSNIEEKEYKKEHKHRAWRKRYPIFLAVTALILLVLIFLLILLVGVTQVYYMFDQSSSLKDSLDQKLRDDFERIQSVFNVRTPLSLFCFVQLDDNAKKILQTHGKSCTDVVITPPPDRTQIVQWQNQAPFSREVRFELPLEVRQLEEFRTHFTRLHIAFDINDESMIEPFEECFDPNKDLALIWNIVLVCNYVRCSGITAVRNIEFVFLERWGFSITGYHLVSPGFLPDMTMIAEFFRYAGLRNYYYIFVNYAYKEETVCVPNLMLFKALVNHIENAYIESFHHHRNYVARTVIQLQLNAIIDEVQVELDKSCSISALANETFNPTTGCTTHNAKIDDTWKSITLPSFEKSDLGSVLRIAGFRGVALRNLHTQTGGKRCSDAVNQLRYTFQNIF